MLVVLCALPHLVQAQTCFKAKPLPDCKQFWITELVGAADVAGEWTDNMVSGEVGLMVNLNKKHAVGGTGFVDLGNYAAFGVKGRYRFWLNKNFGIDAGVGAGAGERWLVLADGSLVFQGWIGIGARIEHYGGDYPGEGYYATAKLGGWPAVGATGVLAIVGAVVLAITWVTVMGAG
jgi:hypothetical protein